MYSIGQIAKLGSVSNRTLRYYEELGLITPQSRGSNRYRYYDDSHLRRLQTIKSLQDAGFALKEIVTAFAPVLDPQGQVTPSGQEVARKIFDSLKAQKDKLIEKQKELALSVEELQKTMHQLESCFVCPKSGSLSECARCETGPKEVTQFNVQNLNHQKVLNGGLDSTRR
jgi:DNA-binding transcriptional MerR regulator